MWGLLTSKNMGSIWGEVRVELENLHMGKLSNELPIIIEFARKQVVYKTEQNHLK